MTEIINPLGLIVLPIIILPNLILLLFRKRKRHSSSSKLFSIIRLISGIACLALLVINTKGEQLSFESVGNFTRFVAYCTGFCCAYIVSWILYFIRQNAITNLIMLLAVVGIYMIFMITFKLWYIAIPLAIFLISHVFIIIATHQEHRAAKSAKKEQTSTQQIS